MTRRPTEKQPGNWMTCSDCLGTGTLRGSERRCPQCEGEGSFPSEQRVGDNDNASPLANGPATAGTAA